jgi:CHAD domain-containing protein
VCVFGAQVLLKHLAALENEIEGVRTGGADIEHIHRMRVATRRLRAALPLFNDCLPRRKGRVWVEEIRKITRSLGAARDADVQIEVLERYYKSLDEPEYTRGIARLLLRLSQRRQALQPDVVEALDHFIDSGTLPALRVSLQAHGTLEEGLPFGQMLYQHANDSLQPRLSEFLDFDSIVRLPERVTELHAMRIAAKRLRYTMETFAPLYANGLKRWLNSIRDAQETLGSIHDCDVWGTFLPLFLEEEHERGLAFYGTSRPFNRLLPGIQAMLADRKAERERLYAEFVPQWETWQRKGFWQELGRILQVPVVRSESLYPPPA